MERAKHLGDFTLGPRVLPITAVALVVGAASAVTAFALLRLIGLITNAVFYQRVSTSLVAPGAQHHSPWLILLAPIAGGLVVGLMARPVGSILAQLLRLSADVRKTLLVAGAAGGMAATFNAPMASVLLAVELLLFEWRPGALSR